MKAGSDPMLKLSCFGNIECIINPPATLPAAFATEAVIPERAVFTFISAVFCALIAESSNLEAAARALPQIAEKPFAVFNASVCALLPNANTLLFASCKFFTEPMAKSAAALTFVASP